MPNTRTSPYVFVDYLPHAPLLLQALVDGTTAAATADASSREAAAANADCDRLQHEIGSLRQYLLRGGATPSVNVLTPASGSSIAQSGMHADAGFPLISFPVNAGPRPQLQQPAYNAPLCRSSLIRPCRPMIHLALHPAKQSRYCILSSGRCSPW